MTKSIASSISTVMVFCLLVISLSPLTARAGEEVRTIVLETDYAEIEYEYGPEWCEYGVFTAYDTDGKAVWTYETGKYVETETAAVCEIGRRGDRYYLTEGGTVVALDVRTGAVIWKNSDYGGNSTVSVFGDDAIYMCGYYGPDFYAVSYDGRTVKRISEFDSDYFWASKMELLKGTVAVYLMGGTEDYDIPQIFYVDTENYQVRTAYTIKSTEAWKSAYMDFINEQDPCYDSFDGMRIETYKLIDINGDEIPELYINYGSTAGGEMVCTYANGKVRYEWLWVDGLSYLEGKNIFMDSGGHMDVYYDAVYTIENGTIKELHRGEYGAADNSRVQYDSNGNPIYDYYWDGAKVSKAQYNTLVADVYSGQRALRPIPDGVWDKALGRYTGNGLCSYKEIIEEIDRYGNGTKNQFTDVSSGDWFSAGVKWATDNNVTTGTSDTVFSPNSTCTKAQMLTFLWRAQGQPEPNLSNPFSDVGVGDYYYKAALWAYEKELTDGGIFDPDLPCSRSMAVTYLWELEGEPGYNKNTFIDVPNNAEYAVAVAWAVDSEITTGTSEKTFSPDVICTRAQIVTLLYRYSVLV